MNEQDVAVATPECKLIDIDEEEEIDIVLKPFPLYFFATFSLTCGFLTDPLVFAFPISSHVALICLLTIIGKECICMPTK